MRKHKLVFSALFAILLLALVVGVGLADKFPPPEIKPGPCTSGIQAGRVDVELPTDGIEPVKVPIRFGTAFCQPPVVVATAGENVGMVCVVEVTEDGFWLEFQGMGNNMQVFWQATVPTQ